MLWKKFTPLKISNKNLLKNSPMIVKFLDKVFYKNDRNNWDDKELRNLILSYIEPTHVILDLGAGAGIVEEMNFKTKAAKVCGIDMDLRVLENPYLDEAKVARGEQIPYENSKFDIVFCDNVFEHLSNPETVFKEVNRVLKKNGLFIAKTPNKYHYVPLFARLTPLWFHKLFNQLRGRKHADTFPTVYKVNCRKDIADISQKSDFSIDSLTLIERRPEYLRFFFIPYLFGILYERLVNKVNFLHNYKVVLMCVLKKQS